jgi:hypothetical protein
VSLEASPTIDAYKRAAGRPKDLERIAEQNAGVFQDRRMAGS